MTLELPSSFLDADEVSWLAAVDQALKGRPRESLFSETEDGLEVAPLYAGREDVAPREARPAGQGWKIVQRIDHPDPAAANALLKAEIAGGADGVEIVLAGSTSARGFGVVLPDLAAAEKLLADVDLTAISLRLAGGAATPLLAAMVQEVAARQGLIPHALNVTWANDPIASFAVSGAFHRPVDDLALQVADAIAAAHASEASVQVLHADGRVWHDAGASPAQQLALVMATAIQFMRWLEGVGVAPEAFAPAISFTLAADANQTATLAMARAARRLWAAVLDAAQLPEVPMRLHMETSWRMMTARDPWVNMLRATVATFAAGVGGADSISVMPFTEALGLPDAFARRAARNTQIVLLHESNLFRVADPAAGAGAIEARTDGLVASAWSRLQRLEAVGGIMAGLQSGWVQERLSGTRTRRAERIGNRKDALTGISAYPDLSEAPVEVLNVAQSTVPTPSGQSVSLPAPGKGEWFASLRGKLREGTPCADLLEAFSPLTAGSSAVGMISPLPRRRLSEDFEALRSTAEAEPEKAKVFLAPIGALAQFTARASWARNFFGAGGLSSEGGEPYAGLENMVQAAKASGASLVCLVSSDRLYAEQGVAAAEALKSAGIAHLYMAGRQKEELAEVLSHAGVETFLFEGCAVLDLLQEAQIRAGLPPSLTKPGDAGHGEPEIEGGSK